MHKLARVASIIVNVTEMCGKYDLNEEDLPTSLLAILHALQRFISLVNITSCDSHNLTMGQRAGCNRKRAEGVLQEKGFLSAQGSDEEDQALR
jgi:hypothetical protein